MDVFYTPDWGWHGAGILEARTQRVIAACDATTWFSNATWGACFGELLLSLVDGRHSWLYQCCAGTMDVPTDTILTNDKHLLALAAAAYNPAPGLKYGSTHQPHTGPLPEWQGRYWLTERAVVGGNELSDAHLTFRRESYSLTEVVPLAAALALGLICYRRGCREIVEHHHPGVIFDWVQPGVAPRPMVVTDHLVRLASPLRVSVRPPRRAPTLPVRHGPMMASPLTQMSLF